MNEFCLRILTAICITMAIAGTLTGCAKSGRAEWDSETGSANSTDSATGVDSGTITGTQTDSNDGIATATESATDSTADTDDTATSVDTGTGIETVHQAPVDIRITNMTSETVFLDGYLPIAAERNSGDQWTAEQPVAPFCMMGCQDWEQFGYCCIDCDYDVALVSILPGDTYTYTWEGRFFKTETETCECACHYSEDPIAGEYRFSVDVFTEISCGPSTCTPPPETGIIYSYIPEGEPRRYSAVTSIPHTDGDLEIRIVADDDTETDSDTMLDTGTGTGNDSDTTTETGDSDSATTTDTATGNGVQQQPVEVRVTNRSLSTVYLDGVIPVHGARKVNDYWTDLTLNQPGCAIACDEVSTDPEVCCIQCEMATMAYALLPGDVATFTWEGLIYQRETATCDCGCYYSELPRAGDYQFSVSAHAGTECYLDPCDPPTESGMLYDRLPVGESRDFLATFTVPHEGSSLKIEISRDDRCDDGTVPLCDMVIPVCTSPEILAYRNDCYQCVDPETCAP